MDASDLLSLLALLTVVRLGNTWPFRHLYWLSYLGRLYADLPSICRLDCLCAGMSQGSHQQAISVFHSCFDWHVELDPKSSSKSWA